MLAFFSIAIALFAILNFVAIRSLWLFHPARRRLLVAIAVFCNLMWPMLPAIYGGTDVTRFIRAFFGPPWFGWLVFVLVESLFVAVLALAWLAARRRTPFRQFARRPSAVFLAAVGVAAIAGWYDATVPLRIERVPVAIRGLPPSAEGRRIALMGDLHVGLFTRPSRLRQFFATASSLHPDAIVLDGDLIDDDPHFIPKLLDAAGTAPPDLPLVAVLGNHEMYGDPFAVIGKLRGSRIHLLVNEGTSIGSLWLAGVSDYAASRSGATRALLPDLDRALEGRPAGSVPIVLAHQPKVFDAVRAHHLPLALVAHTHGGQCGIRALHWSVAGLFLPYHMGLYRVGDSQLYVNTGTGYWLLPFRLGMTPEITLIELHRR